MQEDKNAKVSYEANLARLEEIVQQLERGNATLEESVSLYEEGIKCAEAMQKKLSATAGKITKLEKKLDAFFETPFEDEGEEE